MNFFRLSTPPNTDGTAPLIDLQNISKVYKMGDFELYALRDVSLRIRAGEYVSIIGTSGSGKSTLMNLLGFLDRPTEGVYKFRGDNAGKMSRRRLARLRNREIGFVFQSFNLLPRISARRQVEVPMMYAGTAVFSARQRAKQALEDVSLGDRLAHKPEELSGGQKQRVAIARALVNQPSLLLADEPTGALDTKTSDEILGLCERMHREHNLTIVMVTHDMAVAERTHRIITMRDGEIVSDVPNNPAGHATNSVAPRLSSAAGISAPGDVLERADDGPAQDKVAPANGSASGNGQQTTRRVRKMEVDGL